MGAARKPKGEEARRGVVTLAAADPRVRELVEAAAAQAGLPVRASSERPLARESGLREIYVVNALEAGAFGELERVATAHGPAVVAVTERDGPEPIELLETAPSLRHVFVRAEDGRADTLATTFAKLAGAPLWGLAGYWRASAETHEIVLADYARKSEAIAAVEGFAAGLGAFRELPVMAATITSELLMNGMFNAPWDAAARRAKYADRARDGELRLERGEEVTLGWGCDGQLLVVSLADNFGRLDRATAVANLARSARLGDDQIRRVTAGAGVGLYMLLHASSQLDVHVAPGQRTEVCAVVRLSRRFRDFEERGHAINFFEGPAGGRS